MSILSLLLLLLQSAMSYDYTSLTLSLFFREKFHLNGCLQRAYLTRYTLARVTCKYKSVRAVHVDTAISIVLYCISSAYINCMHCTVLVFYILCCDVLFILHMSGIIFVMMLYVLILYCRWSFGVLLMEIITLG